MTQKGSSSKDPIADGAYPLGESDRRLRYFLAVASMGSVSKAEEDLGISQPSLSRQISLL